ncbi:hypothetical protein CC1G_05112 [Coprinopsis cinerea okayama7|uniref:Transcription factor domain-containing protein n=1 Tax=Coprinopsis cinerea (strain Okayama-7 / 130 / ATCC MYA-4618 / FGSC 9003) TaxID=240176 RepID=A8NFW4_COPC7|nr:hypothetical protein CC1G_05112 [Coprinopsis cinerea okayama7\|eukprot:XP_001833412.2 hypothetical protein CC1G_05112 [Coprinopsis cinerea okayama7\
MSRLSNYSDAVVGYNKWSKNASLQNQVSHAEYLTLRAIYGKSSDPDNSGFSYSTRLANAIPTLHQDFFCSQFWRWFCIQRPILDAAEFSSRFLSHQKGERTLGPEGGIITMLLATWAFSYGLNERGLPIDEPESQPSPASPTSPSTDGPSNCSTSDGTKPTHRPPKSKEKFDQMVQQILDLVDYHGIMRRPTLDGVRVLLLLLPLLEDTKPFERIVIHDTAMSQIQTLCTLAPSTAHPARPLPDDASTRARLFWYAYTQEGLSTGLRGGRFNLHSDDYDAFQLTLPSYRGGLPSPPSPTSIQGGSSSFSTAHQDSQALSRLVSSSTLPLQINAVCRRIHSVLTGPKAARRADEHNLVDAHGMREIWHDLDQCWRELSVIRRNAASNEDPASRCDTERYACAWQIFIFECHNVIRESLKQYMSTASRSPFSSSRPSSHSSGSSPYLPPDHLHLVATRNCLALLPKVIKIMQFCVTNSTYTDRSGLFTWDSGLVRDGCFYAGYLAASTDADVLEAPLDAQASERDGHDLPSSPLTTDEAVMICLAVMSSKRWLFSKSDEREETIRMIWEARKAKRHGQPVRYGDMTYDATYPHANGHPSARLQDVYQPPNQTVMAATSTYLDRSMLPSLNVFTHQRRVESAPTTACTTDGHGAAGWPSYTPPGTATSLTTSTGTGPLGSIRGSPEFSNVLPTYKPHTDESYYHGGGELDHFTYNVPIAPSHPSSIPASMNAFSHRNSPNIEGHSSMPTVDMGNYSISSQPFNATGGTLHVSSGNDYGSCPQFGDNCNGSYH